MQITMQYEAQAKRAAGIVSEMIEVSDFSGVSDCIREVADAHGEQLKAILVKPNGEIQPTLLVFLNDAHIVRNDENALSDGDILTLMTPISGG